MAGQPKNVPERLVNAVALTGDPARARIRLQEYRSAGLDVPVIYPVAAGRDPLGSVRTTLAELSPAP